jgi:hypothetical protein
MGLNAIANEQSNSFFDGGLPCSICVCLTRRLFIESLSCSGFFCALISTTYIDLPKLTVLETHLHLNSQVNASPHSSQASIFMS